MTTEQSAYGSISIIVLLVACGAAGCGDNGGADRDTKRGDGIIEAPYVTRSKEKQLTRAPSNLFGSRPTAGSQLSPAVSTDAAVGPGSYDLSADGQRAYYLIDNTIVLVDVASRRELHRVQARVARGISLCGDWLAVVGASRTHYEYWDNGRFQRHWEMPPSSVPSAKVDELDIWLLDPISLQARRGYSVIGDTVSFAKDAPYAVVESNRIYLDYLDLAAGQKLARFSIEDYAEAVGMDNDCRDSEKPQFESVSLSPDGQSLQVGVDEQGRTTIYPIEWTGDSLRVRM